jgi:serine/threonine-protein kinase
MTRARRASVLALALAVASGARVARAQAPSANDKAAADVLYQAGKQLMKEGKFAEACPKFAESQRLDPGIGTMLWLADCYEKNGQTASAWAQFREAQAEAAKRKDRREKVAADRAAQLANKLSTLVIGVAESAEVPGFEVKRDGTVVGKPLWGTKVPIDPGTHTISASAPGKKPWETKVEVPAKPGTVEVAVLPLEDAHASSSAPPSGTKAAGPAPDRASSSWTSQHTFAVVAAGVAVVGIGLGVVFGLRTKSKLDESNADGHCREGNLCDAFGVQAREDAKDAGTISTIGFIAGGAALAAAAVLWFSAPKPAPARSANASRAWIAPSFDGHRAGIQAGASW